MVRTQLAVAELLWNLVSGKTGNTGRVSFFPQKPACRISPEGEIRSVAGTLISDQKLERATPESQGISSDHLREFLNETAQADRTDIHQILVVRNEKVICECGFDPYPAGMWHVSYSLCKSITGMAIGMLIEEGKISLQDRMIDFFKKRIRINTLRQKDITVEDLLTMRACVDFNESGIVTGDDWVRGFLESGLTGTPKEDFEYNSMNSYMISAIITEVTGESMMEYLRPRLWEPLGISQIFWESCPKGITKGGWGLFIRPEDVAKLGILCLNKGVWRGKRILPEQWVEASCTKHATPPDSMGRYGYGYQIWMGSREGSFNFNGMLGQNMIAYPDLNMLVVTNAGSSELFQNCRLMEIVKKYFETNYFPAEVLPENTLAYARLQNTVRGYSGETGSFPVIMGGGWKKTVPAAAGRMRADGRRTAACNCRIPGKTDIAGAWDQQSMLRTLAGREYVLEDSHVGLMPIFMQVFHNNYTDGISRVGFEVTDSRLFIRLTEGEETHRMEVGFRRAAKTDVSFHGEYYRIGLRGETARDEDGRSVLKLDFAFLEEACRRKAKIFFAGDKIEIRWDETPGKGLIMEGIDLLTDSEGRKGFVMNAVRDVGGVDLFELMLERMVQPVVHGSLQPENGEN